MGTAHPRSSATTEPARHLEHDPPRNTLNPGGRRSADGPPDTKASSPDMKALQGRHAGRRQPGKADPLLAVDDSLTSEPDDPASVEALAARDRTGWPPHPSERRDFYHRIRVFPPGMAGWRKRMLREIVANPARFPCASGTIREEIQARLDDGISFLREVARILARSPRRRGGSPTEFYGRRSPQEK